MHVLIYASMHLSVCLSNLSTYLSIYLFIYCCIYVSMYLSINLHIYVLMYACTPLAKYCMHVFMYVCIHVRTCVCMHVCVCVSVWINGWMEGRIDGWIEVGRLVGRYCRQAGRWIQRQTACIDRQMCVHLGECTYLCVLQIKPVLRTRQWQKFLKHRKPTGEVGCCE